MITNWEVFLREKTLSWVRKEIRKYKRTLYLLEKNPDTYAYRGDKKESEEKMEYWMGVAGRICKELGEL